MLNNEMLVDLNQVWGDRVKGSWWKALVLILIYFLARIRLEGWVLYEGIKRSGQEASVADFENLEKVMQWMAEAQWQYHLVTFILLILLLAGIYLFKFKIFDFKSVKVKLFVWTLLMFIFFFLLNIILSIIISYLQPDYQSPINQQAVETLVKNMALWGAFLNIVILTPITEELILRGLMMKYIFPLTPYLGAIVAALIFTMLHVPTNLIDFLLYFILSAGITFVYWRTRKIEYAIFYHMLQNLIGFIQMQLL